jgi:hypothetical protein
MNGQTITLGRAHCFVRQGLWPGSRLESRVSLTAFPGESVSSASGLVRDGPPSSTYELLETMGDGTGRVWRSTPQHASLAWGFRGWKGRGRRQKTVLPGTLLPRIGSAKRALTARSTKNCREHCERCDHVNEHWPSRHTTTTLSQKSSIHEHDEGRGGHLYHR